MLEGGVQPYGKEGRYDTQPIPNIRLGRRVSLQRVEPASNPLVPGPHCDIGRASRAQGAGSARGGHQPHLQHQEHEPHEPHQPAKPH